MDTEYGNSYGYARNPMATAAVVLGVISIMTCLIFYISIPCGAMAALCAILSRGKNPMPGKSKVGIVCGLSGLVLSLLITLASVWTVLTNPQMRAYMERYLQYYLGDSSFDLDQELATMFPALKGILGLDESGSGGSSPQDGSGGHFDGLFPEEGTDGLFDGLFPSDGADDPQEREDVGEGSFI